ncbi:MAG: CPBP family intramembrane glutamic endopeptidase [Phycisphaerales bacterium]
MSTGRRASSSADDPSARADGPSYLEVSRRPLHGLVFLAPLILAYELGLVFVLSRGGGGIETVEAHRALLHFLSRIGFPPEFLLYLGGAVLAVLMLTWHVIRRDPWRVGGTTIAGMAAESIILTLPLLAFGSILAGLAVSNAGAGAGDGAGQQAAANQTSGSAREAWTAEPAPGVPAAMPATVLGTDDPAAVADATEKVDAAPATPTWAAADPARAAGRRADRAAESPHPAIMLARGTTFTLASAPLPTAGDAGTSPRGGGPADEAGRTAPGDVEPGVAPDAGAAASESGRGVAGNLAISIGAGLYEELFFRWILIAIVHVLLVDVARLSDRTGLVIAVVCSAAAFAFYHDLAGPDGRLDVRRLAFFFVAGLYFGAIFALRGYAIVAGVHASYDIATVILGGGE